MLGKVGVLTPEEARQAAREALRKAAQGKDPSADRHALRADVTISELIDRYLKDGPADKPAKKASTWATDTSNLHRHVAPVLGRKSLAALTAVDVQRFQRDVTDGKTKAVIAGAKKRGRIKVTGGPGTASRATVVLAGMLAWAVKRGWRADNPAKGVKLNKLRKRERFLSGQELARLGEAFSKAEKEGVNKTGLAMIRLLLLTGARRTEIASLRWSYVDFERGALRLPNSKTDEKVVPLGAPALAVLAKMKSDDATEWVFPAARGEGHFKGMPRIWKKVATMAGLKVGRAAGSEGVRVHDLRHGFASVAVADGDSIYLVGKVLGHTQVGTTQRYAHLQIDPVRAVADRTSKKLDSALKGRGMGAKVVTLSERRRA